jgi:hypothetical protein
VEGTSDTNKRFQQNMVICNVGFFFVSRCLEFIWSLLSELQDCSSSLQAGKCSCGLAAIPLARPKTVSIDTDMRRII